MKDRLESFDRRLTNAVQSLSSFGGFMRAVTHLGDGWLVIPLGAVAATVSWITGYRVITGGYVAALTVAGMGEILKLFVRRSRPDTAYTAMMRFRTYSFPSGHSLASIMVYGLSAIVLIGLWPTALSWLAATTLLLLAVIVGISRIYLGAHFPSDVISSWLFGTAALLVISSRLLPL